MKRILVTGGCGYIGSHTCVELFNAGYEVVIIDNLINSYDWILEQIERITGKRPYFYQIDLRNKTEVRNFFYHQPKIEAVIHFAALKAVGESVEKPLLYYENNIFSLINLLEGMEINHCNRMIFSSSCTVYGEPEYVPIREDAPVVKAQSPYGNSKKISEEILNDYVSVNNFQVISLRYFNPVGAHPSALLGEYPRQKPKALFPSITQVCSGRINEFFVHGNDYPTEDGTAIRDYFHVCDLAKAHIKAYEYLNSGKSLNKFEVFNLGSEKGYSVMEIIHTFEKVNNVKVNYKIGPRRPGDVSRIWADSGKAKQILGWELEYSLEDMVRTAWEWEKFINLSKITK